MPDSGNDEIVGRYYREVVQGGRRDVADDLFAHRDPYADMSGVIHGIAEIHDAIPDLSVNVGSVENEGDRVSARVTLRGTFMGAFQGIPPSRQEVEISISDSFEIVDGRISSYESILVGSSTDAFRFSPLPGYADIDPPRRDDEDDDEDPRRDDEDADEGYEPLPGDPDVDPPVRDDDGGDVGI